MAHPAHAAAPANAKIQWLRIYGIYAGLSKTAGGSQQARASRISTVHASEKVEYTDTNGLWHC